MSSETTTPSEHKPVYSDWRSPAPRSCSCGSEITMDGLYYKCRDSGVVLT